MTAPTPLDRDNPWPGLDAFDEGARAFFHGREAEVDELLHRLQQAPMTVLFGQSGLGKSSLLRAGLMPALRERHHLPVLLRIDWRPSAPPPQQQLRDALQARLQHDRVDAPPMAEGESLWHWLHREGLELWDDRNFPCTPVFLIDQFEEVFTLGERTPDRVLAWSRDLGDLAENRIPADLAGAAGLQLRAMPYKLLLSLREDFLPELEGWRRALPSLGRNRMRLLPLRPQQAMQAVHRPAAHLMTEALAWRIVQFVAAAKVEPDDAEPAVAEPSEPISPEPALDDASAQLLAQMLPPQTRIEPALLSLFCRGLNDQRRARGLDRFDDALLDGAKQGILDGYYEGCFEGMPESVRRFVATELITEKGYRNSVSKDDATPQHMSEAQLAQLIDRRLLRLEDRYGMLRIELTHDLLTRVVRQHRDQVRREAAEAQRASEERSFAAAQRAALEAQMQEREAQLQADRLAEAQTASRRLKRLAWGLATVAALAVGMTVLAWRRGNDILEAQDTEIRLRQVAEQQIIVAQDRYRRVADSLDMKRAVLAGDQPRIREHIARLARRSDRPWTPEFTTSAKPRGFALQGKPIYTFELAPTAASATKMRQQVAVVTFRMDHPSFRNALLVTGPERGFTAAYEGWGCLRNVVVLLEYLDPDRGSELTEIDMCRALGW